ncbi:hypothetical protein COU78_05615 [Candidatus Peregrinibacteria bacterium CG10_big_fil_rev_8_21_14_0_10_49_24]|nr:MAG: hypothetical protein COU78_05615 [Candidatus Peregrinibacteria bacterium CG10_big_fil_rev_8_21_14_0_10_49_24]PJA67077.1 MAG: hypothetical protein CO157_06490 [Candidatus Peregrinibacteria bacterium CG_4_9_14_3_um_filter_49_12]
MLFSPLSSSQHAGMPRVKHLCFSVVPVLLIVVSVEMFSLFALQFLNGMSPAMRLNANVVSSYGQAGETGDQALASTDDQVPHPYIGAAHPPTTVRKPEIRDPDFLENYGFGPNTGPFPREKKDNEAVVAIFGGSVAKQFALTAPMDTLAAALKQLPEYADKDIVFTVPSNYGFKQPQQLLTLNYLMSIGAKFDAIIVIDGFNDVAMPFEEDYTLNVFPFYPRFWNVRMQSLNTAPEMRHIIGRIGLMQERQKNAARIMQYSPLRISMTAQLVWQLYDKDLEAKILEDEKLLFEQQADEQSGYIVTGPSRVYDNSDQFFGDLVSNWKESSLLMHQIAKANGMRYFHILQPNQYVPNSKQMGPAEKAVAFRENHYYRDDVEMGYPLLRQAGKELREQGVQFYDMTLIFEHVNEQTYIDDCCHLTVYGYNLFNDAIAEAITSDSNR